MSSGRVDTLRYRRNDARPDRLIGGRNISRKEWCFDREWFHMGTIARTQRQPQFAPDPVVELLEKEHYEPNSRQSLVGAGYDEDGYLVVNHTDGTDYYDPDDIRAYRHYCIN